MVETENNVSLYDIDLFKDKITISSGNSPKDYEVIVNIKYKDLYELNKEIDAKVNNKKLKVVGYYKSDDVDYMLTNNNTIKYDIVSKGKDLYLSVKDKDKALKDYRNMGLNIKDSYVYSRDKYVKDRTNSMASTLIFSVVILSISLIEIYLMMRSSFLSRIK